MAKADEILSWLNSDQKFDEGKALYDKYGISASLKRIFTVGGETQKNKSSLAYELGKLIKFVAPVSKPKPAEIKKKSSPTKQEKKSNTKDSSKVKDQSIPKPRSKKSKKDQTLPK